MFKMPYGAYLLVLGVGLFAGCYTQLHPPLDPNPPVAPDSTVGQDTVYQEIVRERYYPYWDPYSPYYYSRYDRWRYYYGTPWWAYDYPGGYRHSYVPRYYYYPSPPVISPSSSHKVKEKINVGRKLPLWGSSPTPKKETNESNQETQTGSNPINSSSQKDQDEETETTDEKDTKKTNQGRKVPW